jgi:hypothetical protein
MPQTFRINKFQREFFGNHVSTFEEASATIREQLSLDEPDLEVLFSALGSIQHDLNTLRHAFLAELATVNG